MITVTFPTRPAVAVPPEPSSTVAPRPHGQGFGGVFALLQQSPDAPGDGPSAQGSPVETTETSPDQPASDARPDQDEDRQDGAGLGTSVPVDRPDQSRTRMPQGVPDVPPATGGPVAGQTDAPILMTLVTTPGPTTVREGEVPAPAEPEPDSRASPAPVIPVTPPPAVTGLPGSFTTTGSAEVVATVALQPSAGQTDIPPATGPNRGEGGPQGPVPPIPVSAATDPATVVAGAEIIEGAGLILLAVDRTDTGRKSPLLTGVPAFWAAREIAETEAPPASEPASPSPTLAVKDVAPPKPSGQARVDGVTLPPVGEEPLSQRDALAPPAPAFPQATAAGPASSTTLPSSVPAGPATLPPQVPAQIAAAIAARPERPLELRLAPVELGGMTLNLRQDGDILRVVLQADRPDTLDLLRRNGDILLEELRLAGFSGADLSFADEGGARHRPEPAQSRVPQQTDGLRASPAPQTSTTVHSTQGLDLRL